MVDKNQSRTRCRHAKQGPSQPWPNYVHFPKWCNLKIPNQWQTITTGAKLFIPQMILKCVIRSQHQRIRVKAEALQQVNKYNRFRLTTNSNIKPINIAILTTRDSLTVYFRKQARIVPQTPIKSSSKPQNIYKYIARAIPQVQILLAQALLIDYVHLRKKSHSTNIP